MKTQIYILASIFTISCGVCPMASAQEQTTRFNKMRYDRKAHKADRKYGSERFNRLDHNRKEAYEDRREKRAGYGESRFNKMRYQGPDEVDTQEPKSKFNKMRRDRRAHREKRLQTKRDRYKERIENLKMRHRSNPDVRREQRLRRLNEEEAEFNRMLSDIDRKDAEWLAFRKVRRDRKVAERMKEIEIVEEARKDPYHRNANVKAKRRNHHSQRYKEVRAKRSQAMKEHQKDRVEKMKDLREVLRDNHDERQSTWIETGYSGRDNQREEFVDQRLGLLEAIENKQQEHLKALEEFQMDVLQDIQGEVSP